MDDQDKAQLLECNKAMIEGQWHTTQALLKFQRYLEQEEE